MMNKSRLHREGSQSALFAQSEGGENYLDGHVRGNPRSIYFDVVHLSGMNVVELAPRETLTLCVPQGFSTFEFLQRTMHPNKEHVFIGQ